MTRFARAQGSKACNQKVPGEATKWEEMKVMTSSPNNKQESGEASAQKCDMKARQKSLKKPKTNVWAIIDTKVDSTVMDNKSENEEYPSTDDEDGVLGEDRVLEGETNGEPFQGKGKREESSDEGNSSEEVTEEESIGDKESLAEISEKDFGKAKVSCQEVGRKEESEDDEDEAPTEVGSKIPVSQVRLPSLMKKGMKRQNLTIPSLPHKIKHMSQKGHLAGPWNGRVESEKPIRNETMPKKIRIMGVRVKEEDKGYLLKIKKEMEEKGASETDVRKAVRIEARRMEKKMKRDNSKICFICRSAGHMASGCPSSGGLVGGEVGLCFRCGSAEHRASSCPSSRTDFPLATCFTCKRTGHIARHCPDNPNGLYPNGGACRGCGSVAHLRRDCPELQKKKAVKKGARAAKWSMGEQAVDALDDEQPPVPTPSSCPPRKKVVRM